MKFRNNMRLAGAIVFFGILAFAGKVAARENIVTAHHKEALKTTASSGCIPATSAVDLDINNVRARLMTGGDMWWNIGLNVAAYEIPKGSGKSSQFAASCWIGGYDKQGQLKVAAQTYRQDGNDYWPGALNVSGKISADTCKLWDRQWKVDRATINKFIQDYKTGADIISNSAYTDIIQWPASGNANVKGADKKTTLYLQPNNSYAPFKDINGDGVYEPDQGEYPLITGDQYIWWVFNDAGNVKQQSLTASMGIEVQTSAFAYATQDFLNDATFYNYRVINRGALTIDSTYIAVWDDADLGYAYDDFIGCDTSRGLGIEYNGTNDDGGSAGHPVNSYGPNPPQTGVDFFQGPLKPVHRAGLQDTFQRLSMTNFTYYNNDFSVIGNPTNGIQIYNYMTGSIRTGQRFSDDFQGAGLPTKGYGSGPVVNAVYWGDPGDNSQWSECACNNNPGDRRFIFSSGPFQLLPGAINDIVFGCVWAKGAGGCPNTNFKTIRNLDDQAQALFDNHFKTVEGPEAPRMVVRELDHKLIFYLINDYGSNNYGESYGRNDGTYQDSLQYHQIVVKAIGKPDSLYRFEGYRVFQLASSEVTSAEIFDPNTGEVDNTKAVEVFQCDVKNGVTQIVNYAKNVNISDTTNIPQIKVVGKDSGIVHSFELTNDQFSTTADKRFVNYHNYYFVAIAYAFNNFARFDPLNSVSTQDVPYLGSAHGAGGTDIKIVVAMPNPSNGDMGTSLNSDYGTGVTITRVEGQGNGGNALQLDDASEETIINSNTIGKAVYKANQGPIDVKVVDPVLVPAYNWVLTISGKSTGNLGIADSNNWTLTAYNSNNVKQDVIYSEQNLSYINEQIVEKYGISVTAHQVLPAGYNQSTNKDGYITSDVSFADNQKPWLMGVQDEADSSFANWIRSGYNGKYTNSKDPVINPCDFNDIYYVSGGNHNFLDSFNNFDNLLSNFSPAKSSWAPYLLAAPYANNHAGTGSQCGFEVAYDKLLTSALFTNFQTLSDVDVVFDTNFQHWTKCAVIEEQEDPMLSEGHVSKFYLRHHASWNLQLGSDGNTPIYSDVPGDTGMSYFPGYAIDQSTGRRLNIVFGEDSYLKGENGDDMIWNPTSNQYSLYDFYILFGGKHIIYVLNSTYDSDKVFMTTLSSAEVTGSATQFKAAYSTGEWVGIPLKNPLVSYRSLKDGFVPTKTRLRFRVNRPYASYLASADTSATGLPAATPGFATNPYYSFSTMGLEPHKITKGDTTNRSALLDKILAVPNPYYGYSGYESNRFDTKVRIVNLPAQVTVYIYSLDGTLVRTLSKNDPNTPYLDWDVKNAAGLPIASGMYLMDVKANGIGEKVIKWFGAMRPIDVTTY